MEGTYEVKIGGVSVGRVSVEKQGLYYRFSCRCRLTGNTMHRLEVFCGGKRTDLGICAPVDGAFGLDRKIPVKRFPTGRPEFLLVPKDACSGKKFVPVYPEEPFSYMTRLKNAYLEIREGHAGIVIME